MSHWVTIEKDNEHSERATGKHRARGKPERPGPAATRDAREPHPASSSRAISITTIRRDSTRPKPSDPTLEIELSCRARFRDLKPFTTLPSVLSFVLFFNVFSTYKFKEWISECTIRLLPNKQCWSSPLKDILRCRTSLHQPSEQVDQSPGFVHTGSFVFLRSDLEQSEVEPFTRAPLGGQDLQACLVACRSAYRLLFGLSRRRFVLTTTTEWLWEQAGKYATVGIFTSPVNKKILSCTEAGVWHLLYTVFPWLTPREVNFSAPPFEGELVKRGFMQEELFLQCHLSLLSKRNWDPTVAKLNFFGQRTTHSVRNELPVELFEGGELFFDVGAERGELISEIHYCIRTIFVI